MKYCSNCGASVDTGAAFCSGCGGSLSGHSNKSRGFWAGVGVAVAGVVVLGGLLWATAGSNSADRRRNEPEAMSDEAAEPTRAEAPGEAEPQPNVVVEEPGFVGKLLGEKPRVVLTVAEGERLALELRTAISTETAITGDRFTATLASPVLVEGYEAFPAGAEVTGHVAHSERSDKVKGRANLTLELDRIVGPDGEELLVKAEAIRFEARSTTKDDAVKIGGASGAGAVVGAILGGKKGAAIGAGVGAGAGTGVVLSTRGEEVVLPQGTKLSTTLASSLTVELDQEVEESNEREPS